MSTCARSVTHRRVLAVLVVGLAGLLGACSEPPDGRDLPPSAEADPPPAPDDGGDDDAEADPEPAPTGGLAGAAPMVWPEAPAPEPPVLATSADGWDAAVVRLGPADADLRGAPAGEHVDIDVRVAASPDQRQQGLMFVEELAEGTGMLFVFDEERTGGFWMRDTLVPLDIAYLGPDGEVRAVLTMEPCETMPCPTYDPGLAYVAALEVPAGWFDSVGVGIGDRAVAGLPVASD
ncbi:MAG: DUF192 domain-containing protein [Nitriliruptoraceae bacterium]|nr:DUF192 domain-containing protein [Nitriliruptoraceae bacterium]